MHIIKNNQVQVPEDAVLMSKTDLKGTILSASDDFVTVSGYQTASELVGKPHNIIRNPMVPKQVFADMWHTLSQGDD